MAPAGIPLMRWAKRAVLAAVATCFATITGAPLIFLAQRE